MKNKIKQFIISLGGLCSYSGKTKTMFVSDTNIEKAILLKFGYGLSFKLDGINFKYKNLSK